MASLAGSLFSLIPGAVKQAPGFGSALQQLLGRQSGPGVQLTRKPAVAGHNPPGGRVVSRLPVAGLDQRQTGAANNPVLRFGEAVREPQSHPSREGMGNHVPRPVLEGVLPQAIFTAEGVGPVVASMKASSQPGSGADLPASGQVPRQRPTPHIRSQPGLGAASSRRDKGADGLPPHPGRGPTRMGRVLDAREAAQPPGVRAGTGVIVNARKPGGPPAMTSRGATPGQQSKPEGISGSSGSDHIPGNTGVSRSASPPTGGQTRIPHIAGDGRSASSPSGAEASDRTSHTANQPQNHVGHTSSITRRVPSRVAVASSEVATRPSHPGVSLTQPGRVEPGRRGVAGSAAAGHTTNQGRLELNLTPRDRPEAPIAVPHSNGRSSPNRRSTRPGTSRSRVGSQHSSMLVQGEVAKGKGSNPVDSLTNQDGWRHPAPHGNGNSRGFVKPVTVEVHRSGEHQGDESPAPLTHSLPIPAPAPLEATASLASLARLTVLHYSRFVVSEQRSSVFTFDGGSLGNVQLTFQESNTGTTLHIMVGSPEVRQMLQRALPNLEQQWSNEGLNFADVSVEVGDTGRESVLPGQGNPAGTPAIESAAADEVAPEEESEGVRYYGYNTVEFVA